MFAGALVAGGLWLLLQLLFTGGALSALDPDEVDDMRTFGVGVSVGSVIAPLVAMFVGGLVAGRLASHYDRRVRALHGALAWAAASIFGLTLMAHAVSELATRPSAGVHSGLAGTAPAPGAKDYVEDQVRMVNVQLKAANAPELSVDDVIEASQYAVTPMGTVDRASLIAQLADKTALSRPEAEAAVTALGERTPDVVAHASRIAAHRRAALDAAEASGHAMLAAGLALLFCLLAAVGGAVLSDRILRRRAVANPYTNRDIAPNPAMHAPLHHTTAPYPAAPGPTTPRNPND